jgi:hypothetical protein
MKINISERIIKFISFQMLNTYSRKKCIFLFNFNNKLFSVDISYNEYSDNNVSAIRSNLSPNIVISVFSVHGWNLFYSIMSVKGGTESVTAKEDRIDCNSNKISKRAEYDPHYYVDDLYAACSLVVESFGDSPSYLMSDMEIDLIKIEKKKR